MTAHPNKQIESTRAFFKVAKKHYAQTSSGYVAADDFLRLIEIVEQLFEQSIEVQRLLVEEYKDKEELKKTTRGLP